MPSENENTSIFQNSVAAKGGENETYQSSRDSQNFQFTPGEVDQSQGITDTHRRSQGGRTPQLKYHQS